MKLQRLIFLTMVLFAIASSISAYPISPRPLRKLCMESQFIVIAKVEGLGSVKDEGYSEGKARLRILEVLKGNISKPVIEVLYSPNMICPAPPEYPKGSTVVAFLDHSRGEKFYTTHGLSYGAKVVDESGLKVYSERISEMLAIIKQGNSPEKEKRIVEWLVRCAEEPVTRWEGAYELSPGGDFMSFYEREQPRDFATLLTKEQRSRLSAALFRSDTISRDEICLISLLQDDEGERLVPFILRYLKKVVDDPPYYTEELMGFISVRMDNEEAIRLTKEYSETDIFDKKDEARRKRVLSNFIALIERRITT